MQRAVAVLQSQTADRWAKDEAFVAIVKGYSPRLLAYIAAMTGSRHTAEDILQETFVTVTAYIDRFESHSEPAFTAWLYRIAYTRTLNTIRRVPYRAAKASVSLIEAITIPGFSATERRASPEVIVEQKETLAELQEILNGLLPQEREAILLQEAGLSYEQIADTLGRSVGAIKSLLVRARTKVDEQMEELSAESQ